MKTNKIKNALAAASALLLPVVTMAADGQGSGTQIDVTPATESLNAMKTAVTTWFDAAQPIIFSILGLGLVIVLGLVGWKLFKRVTNKAG